MVTNIHKVLAVTAFLMFGLSACGDDDDTSVVNDTVDPAMESAPAPDTSAMPESPAPDTSVMPDTTMPDTTVPPPVTTMEPPAVTTVDPAASTVLPPDDPMAGMPSMADLSVPPPPPVSAVISVTNSMPHEMNVVGDWGMGQQLLGPVGGSQTKEFTVSVSPGSQVGLIATDTAATHSVTGSVTTSPETPSAWTIQ